jgi:gliding motility-associated-like protein
MYFDAVNGNPDAIDPTIRIHVFQKSNNAYIQTHTLPRVSDDNVPYTNPACAVGQLRTRRIGYSLDITLNPNVYNHPEGYYMVWERCCRNGVINNIINPGGAGQTFYLEFPPVVRNGQAFINSSPALFPPLSDYACVNQPFFFDFSGTDPDGDELRYSLTTPLNGFSTANEPAPVNPRPAPYPLVQFTPGIGVNNMVPGTPPLTVSPTTGILNLTASRSGLHVFAVRCEEFRNGIKIGEVRREFQLMVLNCPTTTPPNIVAQTTAGVNLGASDTLKFLVSDANRCANIVITDRDPNTVARVRFNPIAPSTLPPSVAPLSGTLVNGRLVLPLCFNECPSSLPVTYIFDAIVEDNSCAVPLLDTTRINVKILPAPNQAPTIVANMPRTTIRTYDTTIQAGRPISFTLTGDDPNKDVITMAMQGIGFNPATIGINFPTTTGNPILTRQFTWTPACNLLLPTEREKTYELKFTSVDTRRCQPSLRDSITVRIKVMNPQTENVPPKITTSLPNFNATNKTYYDTVFVGKNISFDGLGTDVNGDTISFNLLGTGFNPTTLGVRFTNAVGKAPQTAKFSWTPPCNVLSSADLNGKNFRFSMIVQDRGTCRNPTFDTTYFEIFVKPVDNKKPAITSTLPFDTANKVYYDSILVGNTLNLPFKGTDPENDSIAFTLLGQGFDAAGLGMRISPQSGKAPQTGTLTWQTLCTHLTNNTTAKSYDLKVLVNDFDACGNKKFDTVTVRLRVLPRTNLKPSITAALPYDAKNKFYYDSVVVGQAFNFTVTGDDPEKDSVILALQGINLVPSALGMRFTARNGKAPQTGTFLWQTNCTFLPDTVKAADYFLRFIVNDFDFCGNKKYDTIQVRLRVLPNPEVNFRPVVSTLLPRYNATTRIYTDSVKVGSLYQVDILADDRNRDSLLLNGAGIGFRLADFNMNFTPRRGRPLLRSPFVWQTNCSMLNIAGGQLSRTFEVQFVGNDFRDCQRSLRDTIKLRLILYSDSKANARPVATANNLTQNSSKVYSKTITAGETLTFRATVDDADKDSVSITAVGLTDGMTFSTVKGIAPIQSDFNWKTDCSLLRGSQTPKDYTVLLVFQDYKGCGVPIKDTLRVNLRLIPLPNPNKPRIFTDVIGNLQYDEAKREYTRTVTLGEVINMDIKAEDIDKDIIKITGVGTDFSLQDYRFVFNDVTGVAPQTAKLQWQPDCEILKRKGEFRLKFTVVDQNPCGNPQTDEIFVVFKLIDITVPKDFVPYNVFTPNGDGKNDTFKQDIPADNCQDSFIKIVIYNRWGALVYESNDRNFSWDGAGFPPGAYFYHILFKNKQVKGTVTLLRGE